MRWEHRAVQFSDAWPCCRSATGAWGVALESDKSATGVVVLLWCTRRVGHPLLSVPNGLRISGKRELVLAHFRLP